MRKKFFAILLVLFLGIGLVACGGGSDDTGNGGGNGGGGNGGGGNGGGGNGGDGSAPTEIVIMHGAVHEIDPRNPDFSGRSKAQRLAKHEEVEEELNVKIVYEPYPADAPWGSGREEAIINWHTSGQRKADIYWLTTIWLGNIANNNAIVPVDQWLSQYGSELPESGLDAGTYNGQVFGVTPEPLFADKGLFFNTGLLNELGIENPVDIWDAGEWTWDRFNTWATSAKSALGENQYVMGSQPSVWAESLIPLNGGSIVNAELGQVMFNANPAQETYTYLENLSSQGLFEPGGSYDSGSDAWSQGDVLTHPGHLWFVKAENRWGQFQFVQDGEIGVVPFPQPVGKEKSSYVSPKGGEAIYAVANNTEDKAKEELAFEVWNKLQLFETDAEYERLFKTTLQKTFSDEKYVNTFLEIYDNVYFDIHEQIGISSFGTSSWQTNLNAAIKDGTSRQAMGEIVGIYENALNVYLGNE